MVSSFFSHFYPSRSFLGFFLIITFGQGFKHLIEAEFLSYKDSYVTLDGLKYQNKIKTEEVSVNLKISEVFNQA